MTRREYCLLVNAVAAYLHLLQGKAGQVLPNGQFEAAVSSLTAIFQHEFMDIIEVDGRFKYVVFPVESGVGVDARTLVFEAKWFVQALLGIALCRQALVIHREPKGPEPADSDKRLVRLLNQFIRQADPEIITSMAEAKKAQGSVGNIAASVPQEAG